MPELETKPPELPVIINTSVIDGLKVHFAVCKQKLPFFSTGTQVKGYLQNVWYHPSFLEGYLALTVTSVSHFVVSFAHHRVSGLESRYICQEKGKPRSGILQRSLVMGLIQSSGSLSKSITGWAEVHFVPADAIVLPAYSSK